MALENSRKDLIHVSLPPEELAALDGFKRIVDAAKKDDPSRLYEQALLAMGIDETAAKHLAA